MLKKKKKKDKNAQEDYLSKCICPPLTKACPLCPRTGPRPSDGASPSLLLHTVNPSGPLPKKGQQNQAPLDPVKYAPERGIL